MLLERFGGRRAAADEQNRVVAANRAGDLLELRAIDPLGQSLRLPAVGANDEQGVHALETAHQRGHRALAAGRRPPAALGAGPDVGAITRALDQP